MKVDHKGFWAFLFITATYCYFAVSIIAQTVILSEDFSTGSGFTPPTGWSNNSISAGSIFERWSFDNPGSRAVGITITGKFAIFDSDYVGNNGTAEDVSLESPDFDASAYNTLELSFDHYFRGGFGGAYSVDVFDGANWVTVLSGTSSTANAATEQIDITSAANGATNAKVRFRWTGDWSWYWAVDNVAIVGTNPAVDTDNDGIVDRDDLDDDNDGILDYDECPTLDEFNFALSGGGTFTTTFAQGPGRFIADITKLDNSFNINVNGTDVAGEIQFYLPSVMDNITTFVDGSAYGDGTVPNIWTLTGTPSQPILRLIIDNAGIVSLYGAKANGGPLFPMQFTTPPITVSWNPTGLNSVILSQLVIGPTNMSGRTRYLDFPCDSDKDGISNHLDSDADNDGCFDTVEEDIADADQNGIAGTGIPTVDVNGLVTSITYGTPPNNYWTNFNLLPNVCDTDGDNINPKVDLDDDNDGILDLIEQDCGILPPGSTGTTTEVLGGTSVTTIYTNFGDFWQSSVGAISSTLPNTSHDLLAFTTGGVTYTTGVPDDDLYDTNSNGLYESIDTNNDGTGDLAATEMRWQAFSNLNEITNKLSLEGDLNDGAPNNALGLTILDPATEPLNGLLTNGVQGLDLGTGIANVNESWYYNVDIISAAAVGDGIPDLLITQVANPSSTAFQTVTFYGVGWSPMGNAVRVQSTGSGPLSAQVATYELDIYDGTGGIWGGGGVSTTRPIRMAALELSEFGIAPADVGQVVSMKIELASSADVAFVGYNTATFSGLCADVDADMDGIPNRLDLDSDNDGIWDAIEAGHGETVIAGTTTGSVGANGVDDNVETNADSGSLNYSISDSDTDNTDDYLETDSDDDGCYDSTEAMVSDTDRDGIAGTGTPTVNANGLVNGITYTIPPHANWQNMAIYIACTCPQVIMNRHITFKTKHN